MINFPSLETFNRGSDCAHYPGEMVNGSSQMFTNVHDDKTTHPIYLTKLKHPLQGKKCGDF